MNPSAPPTKQAAPAVGVPVHNHAHPTGPVPWSTGLFDCFSDVPNCCMTCWCPCVTFGQVSEIVDKGASSCIANGAIYTLIALVTGCPCLYTCCYRPKMRRQYMLEDDACGDCVVHFFCESCALCQEYRELKNRGFDMSIGWEENLQRKTGGVTNMAPSFDGGMNR